MKAVQFIVLDVDGTMTDGGVYIDNNRVETKKFSIKDGCGIVAAHTQGIKFMILTGRESRCVARRAEELRIDYVYQNVKKKASFLREFMKENNIRREELAYIGDDLNDLYAMREAGMSACPADAAPEIKAQCDLVLNAKGGEGAVREFVELVLKERRLWEKAIEAAFS